MLVRDDIIAALCMRFLFECVCILSGHVYLLKNIYIFLTFSLLGTEINGLGTSSS